MLRNALIIVDLQNDFCPGGALAVPRGDEVVTFANSIKGKFDIVIATQDWHPQAHGSFASNHPGGKPFTMSELNGMPQVLWPDHCVNGTKGAEFHPGLDLHGVTIFRKGTDPAIDSYSAFYDNGRLKSTGLSEYLEELDVEEVSVMGLATDYCVKATAIDAVKAGFRAMLLVEGCRGVGLAPDDIHNAITEASNAGVIIEMGSEH